MLATWDTPAMLFGLAVLEDMTLEPHTQASRMRATGRTKLVRVAVDTTRYRNNVHAIWHLHEASHAQGSLPQLSADIDDLESLEQQTQGDLRYHVQELLLSDLILATHIVRDQRQFDVAYTLANKAVGRTTLNGGLLALLLPNAYTDGVSHIG